MNNNIFYQIKHRCLSNKVLPSILKQAMAIMDNPLNMTALEYIANRKIVPPIDEVERQKFQNELEDFFNYLKQPPKTLVIPKKILFNYFYWEYFVPVDETGNKITFNVNINSFPKYFTYEKLKRLPVYISDIEHGVIYETKIYTESDKEFNWLKRYKLDGYVFIAPFKKK